MARRPRGRRECGRRDRLRRLRRAPKKQGAYLRVLTAAELATLTRGVRWRGRSVDLTDQDTRAGWAHRCEAVSAVLVGRSWNAGSAVPIVEVSTLPYPVVG